MEVIVGLGNPGKRYEATRHNIGFWVIEQLRALWDISLTLDRFQGESGIGTVNNKRVALLKPLAYMNLSGGVVAAFLSYFKLTPRELTVVYDDMDLPVGQLRLREDGGAGGHNGVQSIINIFKGQSFKRIRLGIGRPTEGMDVSKYVLARFTAEEELVMDKAVNSALEAIKITVQDGFVPAMNTYNRKVK
ncbi:MAG: hypothetical protein RLZ12_189 [Bacillota bacterium]